MFEVIIGGYDEKEERRKQLADKKFAKFMEFWKNAYFSYKYGYNGEVYPLNAIYFGIKYFSKLKIDTYDHRELLIALSEFSDIRMMMAFKTPKELIPLFPIIKDYDGSKYECKDYFSTKKYLESIDVNSVLGIDGVDDFLWNYYNYDIMNFSIKEMLVVDRIRKFEGRMGIMETFIEDMGLTDKIHTYTLDKEDGVIYDNVTGECFDVSIGKTERRNRKEEECFKIIETEKN